MNMTTNTCPSGLTAVVRAPELATGKIQRILQGSRRAAHLAAGDVASKVQKLNLDAFESIAKAVKVRPWSISPAVSA